MVTTEAVYIRTPRCIEIIVHDSPISREDPKIIPVSPPRTEGYDEIFDYNGKPATVEGPLKDHISYLDTRPVSYMNRDDADNAAGYTFDGPTINSVTRRSGPRDGGAYQLSGNTAQTCQQFSHAVRLQLASDLAPGSYTITPPNNAFPAVNFDYDPLATICPSIHVNRAGHGPADAGMAAYLSFWNNGFGDEGITDYSAFTEFQIRDVSTNALVYTGSIVLRKSETDLEDATASGGVYNAIRDTTSNLARYLSTTRKFAITGITQANPCVVTAPGHDFTAGQKVGIQYALGMEQINFFEFGDSPAIPRSFYVVANPTATTVELTGTDSTGLSAYTSGGFLCGENQKNAAGTKTYELDYTDALLESGKTYKIYIPNLGVSYPFSVDLYKYRDAVQVIMAGFYNISNGRAKDGRFGYTAPINLKSSGQPISYFKSDLPSWFTTENLGNLPFQTGAQSPWITATDVSTDTWGEFQNAGDWDVRFDNMDAGIGLLIMQDLMPAWRFEQDYNIPTALDSGCDATFWAGTESLPDVMQMIIWHFDAWRRMRESTGEIAGGYEYSDGPDGPSWLTRLTGFVYFPDPQNTFRYAGYAAQLGRILKDVYGLTTLGDTLIAQGGGSYSRAEFIVADMDTYYAVQITKGNAEGIFTPGWTWPERRDTQISEADKRKNGAAGHLYRATGTVSYRTLIESRAAQSLTDATMSESRWSYLQRDDPGKNPTIVNQFTSDFISNADAEAIAGADVYAYHYTKSNGDNALFGNVAYPGRGLGWSYYAFSLTSDRKYLRTAHRQANFFLGANPQNLSFITGLGEPVRQILNEDSLAQGREAPDGVPGFGYITWPNWNLDFVYGKGSAQPWARLPQYRNMFSPSNYDAEFRMVEPVPGAMPLYEYIVQDNRIVPMQEFLAPQMGSIAQLFMFLWANAEEFQTMAAPEQANMDPSATHLRNRGTGDDGTGSNSGDGTSSGEWSPDYVPPPVTLEFALVADTPEINANGEVRTSAGISFGAADPDRVLYATFLGSVSSAAYGGLTSVTLDGDAMTVDLESTVKDASENKRVVVVVASIPQSSMTNPNATSGDLVFTFSTVTMGGSKALLYRGVGYSATPHDTLSALNTTPNSGAIDFPDNGFIVGGAMDYDGSVGYTWSSPLVERFDDSMRFAGRGTLADADGLTEGLGTTVTATVGAGGGEPSALGCVTYPVA